MFALVDCNSFFCSVERAFHPGLATRPVCVLSSNDGCIVALTPEAKALGLKRGDPLFRVRHITERGGVALFSSNIVLYAAMSRRIVSILRRHVAHVEPYSIDECFCDLTDFYGSHLETMRRVAEEIRLWTGVPVSIGIAPTKTLAKMGSKFAKQYAAYRSVCCIDSEAKRRRALSLFPLDDVWGIGRATLRTLRAYGVETPLDFAERSEAWVRGHLALPGLRTWAELNGRPCIDTEVGRRRKSIGTSRTFGRLLTTYEELHEAVAHFAAATASKLRADGSVAKRLTVFAESNPYRDDLPQYRRALTEPLAVATADTAEIATAAARLLRRIYVPGISFRRAGVWLNDISPATPQQLELFDTLTTRPARRRLMASIDSLNHRFGPGTVRLATETADVGFWRPKSLMRTPDYLTDLSHLLIVNA